MCKLDVRHVCCFCDVCVAPEDHGEDCRSKRLAGTDATTVLNLEVTKLSGTSMATRASLRQAQHEALQKAWDYALTLRAGDTVAVQAQCDEGQDEGGGEGFWLAKVVAPKVPPEEEGVCAYTLANTLRDGAETLQKGTDVIDIIWFDQAFAQRDPMVYKPTALAQTVCILTLVQVKDKITMTPHHRAGYLRLADPSRDMIVGV